MSDNLETEVKYAIADTALLRQRLSAAGADPIQPRTLEVNLRFDNPADELRAGGMVLRLRQDSKNWLTLKLPVGPWGTEAKTLRELELEVSDFQVARQILTALGFHVWFTYEKYRETYKLAGAEISVDELPFASFVEIEGSLEQIAVVARLLELEDAPRITAGYVTLFHEARERQELAVEECTFAAWSQAKDGA
jgi:adenylate cyclase class 2